MKSKIISNILLSIAVTVTGAFIYPDVTINAIIISLIGSFLLLTLWSFITKDVKPRAMSKEDDEILHPVTENITILHICNMQKHFGKRYNKNLVETCSCGSNLFRIYREDTDKGTYFQFICANCNLKATGVEFNWKVQDKSKELIMPVIEIKK